MAEGPIGLKVGIPYGFLALSCMISSLLIGPRAGRKVRVRRWVGFEGFLVFKFSVGLLVLWPRHCWCCKVIRSYETLYNASCGRYGVLGGEDKSTHSCRGGRSISFV